MSVRPVHTVIKYIGRSHGPHRNPKAAPLTITQTSALLACPEFRAEVELPESTEHELCSPCPSCFTSLFKKLSISSLRKKKRFGIWVERRGERQTVQTNSDFFPDLRWSSQPRSQSEDCFPVTGLKRDPQLHHNSHLSLFPPVYRGKQMTPKTSKEFYSSTKNNSVHSQNEK